MKEDEKYKQFVAKLDKVEYQEEKAATFKITVNEEIKKVIYLSVLKFLQ